MGKGMERGIPLEKKLPNNHKHIVRLARQNGGVFHFALYEREVRRKITRETHGEDLERLVRQQMDWCRTSVSKLVAQGVLTPQGGGNNTSYRLDRFVEEIAEQGRKPPFQLKPNHRKLLEKAQDGILDLREVYAALSGEYKNPAGFDRQWKIHKGMVKNLAEHGYLEKLDKNRYRVVQQEADSSIPPSTQHPGEEKQDLSQSRGPSLPDIQAPGQPPGRKPHPPDRKDPGQPRSRDPPTPGRKTPEKQEATKEAVRGCVSITAFDAAFLYLSREGRFTREDIGKHPRGPSLRKRLYTLAREGLVYQYMGAYQISETLRDRIETALARKEGFYLDSKTLTRDQREIVRDMYRFSQLTRKQMDTYILTDERFALTDFAYLQRRKIIAYKPVGNEKVYVLTPTGQALARQELPEGVKTYRSKSQYRPSELAHDLLVYNAWQDMRLKLSAEGCTVTGFQTDKDLRSAYNAKGLRNYRLPDLRVFYREPDGKELHADVEIDMGRYTAAQILAKLGGNHNVHWYAPTAQAANRAIQVAIREGFRIARGIEKTVQPDRVKQGVARTLYVTVVDEDLIHKHKLAFEEGRRDNAFSRKKAGSN